MNEFLPRHLVIIRHGESEGDVRRAANKDGRNQPTRIHPKDEKETLRGREQSASAGKWIARFVLDAYGIESFDLCATSPLLRTRQSAESLGIGENWQVEPLLAERNRGKIQGFTKDEHKAQYPESYEQMNKYPFHWVPPGGESMIQEADRANRFLEKNSNVQNILVMTHRDWIWGAHLALENMTVDEVQVVDTDAIHNAQVLHLTNVNPVDGKLIAGNYIWKRTVCPWFDTLADDTTSQWVAIN